MYLTPTKTLLVKALRATFDGDFIDERYRNINIGIEFPEERQNYPGIWVDFEPIGELEHAGIDHTEYSLSDSGGTYAHTRWRYQGYATFTVVAMTARERDGLFDEVIRTFAFGPEHPSTKVFREVIEDNEFIAVNMDFGTVGQRGFASSPGTPWNTDEVIHEATVSMNMIGEFIANRVTGELVPISAILVSPQAPGEPDPSPGW